MRPKPPESMSIRLRDGRTIDLAMRPHNTGEWMDVTLIEVLQPRFPERCPICGEPATSDEHVPPQRLGGQIMTRTCHPCNNRLGSHVEPDLVDWYDDAIPRPGFRSEAVQGRRRADHLLFRSTAAGEFGLIIDGRGDPEITAALASGIVNLDVRPPNRNRYMLALLKSAYLAASLKVDILHDQGAEQVRRDLLAARDASSRKAVPVSALALGLAVLRRYEPVSHDFPPLVRAVLHEEGNTVDGVVLAGRIFVSWSSTLGAEAHGPSGRLDARLEVGTPDDGTVTSVSP
ncbi:HNH endonuclease [Micromonospora sp. 4G57]|nr:HNH endonuclease [Micromonospora sp. 4G57]MDZ5447547.1 HNH endonuclease [Micromonospora sp. 4G57]